MISDLFLLLKLNKLPAMRYIEIGNLTDSMALSNIDTTRRGKMKFDRFFSRLNDNNSIKIYTIIASCNIPPLASIFIKKL
jgi:hypothetical protein